MSEAFIPRTQETHASQCVSLGGPLHDHFATTFGLHRDSILNTSQYFHVTEGLVPDVMDDVLEGCLPYLQELDRIIHIWGQINRTNHLHYILHLIVASNKLVSVLAGTE